MKMSRLIAVLLFVTLGSTVKAQIKSEGAITQPASAVQGDSSCSADDMKYSDWSRKYIYFDYDSLFLKLSEPEAVEKGISVENYRKFTGKIREMNVFLKQTVDNLQPGKKLHFPVPKNRVVNMQDISGKFNIELINEIE